MLTWLSENMGTIIITLLLIGVVIMILRGMIKSKKQGKSTCGCGCSTCPMGGSCDIKE